MSKFPWLVNAVVPLLLITLIACGGGGPTGNEQSSPSPPTGSQSSSSQLAVTVSGSGTGTVSSNPAGVNCTQSCSGSFNNGTTVTLTATAGDDGSVFDGWSGACSGTGACTVSINSATTVTATFSASLQSIQHIIFMLQENRSFDEYFGKLDDYRTANGLPADVDGLSADASNPSANGSSSVSAFHMISMCVENPSPYWIGGHTDFNLDDPTSATPTMDGFVVASARFAIDRNLSDTKGIRAMGYYTAADLPYYYFMASNFGTSDRWFSPVMAETPPNRLYLLAGTSVGHVYPIPSGSPGLKNKNVFQLLQEHGISWKIYVTDPSPSPVVASEMSMFAFSFQHAANFVPISQYFTDLANNTLPEVAMIDPGFLTSRDEHPVGSDTAPGGSVQVGSKYVSSLINALMTSSSWKNSVFILSFDEAGGFYDHVPPQPTVSPDGILPSDLQPGDYCNSGNGVSTGGGNCDFTFTGFRVPLIVVSPFSKQHFVSHTVADFTAIDKLIETRFDLPSLTRRDSAQMDMTEFFDFVNEPWKVPPRPPTQPTNGPCYIDHLP